MTNAQELERRRRLHFYRRVRERIGPHVNAKILWLALVDNIENPDPDYLVFVARMNRYGRRLWKVKLGDSWHLVVFDHRDNHPVTILQPDRRLYCQRRRSVNLRTIV